MNKIILKAKNKKELDLLLKNNITLQENETYIIKEIKKPLNLLFFQLKGQYEITILSKDELKELKKMEEKPVEKKVKPEKKEPVKKVLKKEKVEESIDDKITEKITEFIKVLNLDISIQKIETKSNFKIVNLSGKDVRYIIGEKGIALNSLEILLNSIKEFKMYKIVLDSNNYKAKREETLRHLANTKAEKVLKTKKSYKLSSMTSRERRIIHEEISKYDNLQTESFGEDPKRYLVIKYKED